jgi:hypothetical protein
MTVDPMHNVNPGDPLQLTARQVNAWNKLASQQPSVGATAAQPEPAPFLTLWGKNTGSTTVAQFEALKISGLVLDASGPQFKSKPVVSVGQVDAIDNALAIAVEPIGAGKIGRVAVSGVVPCRITNTDAANKFARPTSSSTILTGASSGPAEIIWMQGGTGTNQQGLVRLGPRGDSVRLCKTSYDWNKGTLATLYVWESGTPPSETQSTGETLSGCVNKFRNVKSGAFVIVAKAKNGSWYLVEAEKLSDSGSCRAPTIGDDDLTTLPGYSASKKQALTHDNGCLKWVDIAECPTT